MDNIIIYDEYFFSINFHIMWCSSGDNSMYNDYTEKTFKEALNAIEQGDVIYYHPWY